MMICSGIILLIVSGLAYANPHIRNIETEILDAVPDGLESEDGTPVVGEEKAALTS
jgi:hypothetical protein